MQSLKLAFVVGLAALVTVHILSLRHTSAPTIEEKTVELHITLTEPIPVTKASANRGLRNVPGKAVCSGMFIDGNGTILTARHCTDGVERIEVLTSDHRVYTASFVARSNAHDLALIRIDRQNTPFFTLASAVSRGETILVLGSPMGETGVLSQGIIAKLAGDQIIVDCSVVPGNSGGPVFDVNGNLVGVAVAVFVSQYGITHLGAIEGPDAVHAFLKLVLHQRIH